MREVMKRRLVRMAAEVGLDKTKLSMRIAYRAINHWLDQMKTIAGWKWRNGKLAGFCGINRNNAGWPCTFPNNSRFAHIVWAMAQKL
jgi:hypothetical protein